MSRLCLAAAAFMLAAAAPTTPLKVSLTPGEAVTLLIDDGGHVSETKRSSGATADAFEQNIARELSTGSMTWASGPKSALITAEGRPKQRPIVRGEIHIKLVEAPPGESLLLIENGYDGAVTYRATMTVKGRTVAAEVCQVRPGLFGAEQSSDWIERFELSDIHLEPWPKAPDAQPVCS
jgi:hypothetical protein